MAEGTLAIWAAWIAASAAVDQGVRNIKAQKAEKKANKRANRIQQRTAELENQRNARRAIAQRRIQQAELISSAQSTNVGSNSSVTGAVGSLQTQTAANIGFANTQLAGQVATSNVLLRGTAQANRQRAIGAASGMIGSFALMGTGRMNPSGTTGFGNATTSPSRANLIRNP